MRWFFLLFILLLALVGYASLLSEATPFRVLASIPFYLFVVSLLGMWWFSYFRAGVRADRGKVFCHALLMLAFGLIALLTGGRVLASGDCELLISSSQSPGTLSRLGVCAAEPGNS